jgi:signal transduction histidine kinase
LLQEMIDAYKISRYSDSSNVLHFEGFVSQGDRIMDKIRIHVKSMEAYELYLYRKKVNSGDNFNNLAYILIVCFGLLTITVSLYGYLIVQKENSQKQAAESQLNEYYTQVEKANTMLTEAEKIAKMGSWEWSLESGKVHWSDGAYRVYNLSPKTFIPTFEGFIEIVHPDDRQYVMDNISNAIEKRISYQISFRELASNETRTIFAVGIPRWDDKGNLEAYFGVLMDITQQSNYEKQLEDFNNALKKSNEELEQFAYAASHDLQEPLRKIRAFGDRLVLKFGTEKEIPGQEYVFRMMDGAERMQILIQDLLAFSRVSRDVGDKVKVNLNDVLKNVMEDLQLLISESNAKIEADDLPKLTSANPVQMHQLFLNIVANAIKFSKQDVTPEIKITISTLRGSQINIPDEKPNPQKIYYAISIKDNGIGFDEKYLDKMFTIFQRLHGRNEYKGTGIGLAICKKICKNHDGFITARSDAQSGSDFIIYLPK